MKKTRPKLVLRHETIRALANLDLSSAFGRGASGEAQCANLALPDTGPAACQTDGIATAACR